MYIYFKRYLQNLKFFLFVFQCLLEQYQCHLNSRNVTNSIRIVAFIEMDYRKISILSTPVDMTI